MKKLLKKLVSFFLLRWYYLWEPFRRLRHWIEKKNREYFHGKWRQVLLDIRECPDIPRRVAAEACFSLQLLFFFHPKEVDFCHYEPMLSSCFCWAQTPQGSKYWHEIALAVELWIGKKRKQS